MKGEDEIIANIALELDDLQIKYDLLKNEYNKLVIEHMTREVDILQFLKSKQYLEFCKFCKTQHIQREFENKKEGLIDGQ